eukprot:CAMPEP_0181202032 /NCGR_PEP_ID=MMETSP1096-20121128/18623_1 /TAXON_ID=156174 ORGANISM="Chrysochromulina ericina, Strain CCMP281" /NCGR_SAMPLE_ID=MMETSP1096 /ASSEMBLY_ACC=CAM_ASM_000453 /LENGTH=146 /DNA_ID=CAMNT_0023292513 /DNA_START=532 /DNA_END=973 /DNA_ORIENTATION=-
MDTDRCSRPLGQLPLGLGGALTARGSGAHPASGGGSGRQRIASPHRLARVGRLRSGGRGTAAANQKRRQAATHRASEGAAQGAGCHAHHREVRAGIEYGRGGRLMAFHRARKEDEEKNAVGEHVESDARATGSKVSGMPARAHATK